MQLIDELDTPEPQVEIEARIVSANRDFARDIGVQFGFVQGNLERVTVGGPEHLRHDRRHAAVGDAEKHLCRRQFPDGTGRIRSRRPPSRAGRAPDPMRPTIQATSM